MTFKRFVASAIFWIGLFYVASILLSFLLSAILPDRSDVIDDLEIKCFWTDALLYYVRCGTAVPAGRLLEVFYNFWTLFVYLPLFGFFAVIGHEPLEAVWYFVKVLVQLILLYVPLILFVHQLWRRFIP